MIKKLSEKNTSAATESDLQYFHTTLIRIAPPKCSVLLGFKKIAWAGREISMTWADWAKNGVTNDRLDQFIDCLKLTMGLL